MLTGAALEQVLLKVLDAWLLPEPGAETPAAKRAGYLDYFLRRLASAGGFLEEALHARANLV